jgi:hypothetical protein
LYRRYEAQNAATLMEPVVTSLLKDEETKTKKTKLHLKKKWTRESSGNKSCCSQTRSHQRLRYHLLLSTQTPESSASYILPHQLHLPDMTMRSEKTKSMIEETRKTRLKNLPKPLPMMIMRKSLSLKPTSPTERKNNEK